MIVDNISFDEHYDSEHGIQIFYIQKSTMLHTLHGHEFYEIFFVEKGSVGHKCNREEHDLHKGSLVFIRPGDIHQYLKASDDFTFYNLVFSKETADKIFSLYDQTIINKLVLCETAPRLTVSSGEIDSLALKFRNDIETIDLKSRSFYNVSLLTFLIPLFISTSIEDKNIPPWFKDLLAKINMNKNYTKGVNYLYSVAVRSKEHVIRSFKKYTQQTPTEYINSRKLDFASNLLKQTDYELIEISQMAGFNSHSHFYHLFKEQFNCSPRAYRLKL